LKNVGGFLREEINLESVGKYISNLSSYKKIKKKIDFIRSRIKRTNSEKVKFYLKEKLKELIDEKKKIIAVAFYERHGSKALLTMIAINKARKIRNKNINNKNKSLLR